MRPNRANSVVKNENPVNFSVLRDKEEDETANLERKVKILSAAVLKERKAKAEMEAEITRWKAKVEELDERLIAKDTQFAKSHNEKESLREQLRAEKSRSEEVVRRTTNSSMAIFKLDKDTTELEGQLLQAQADKAFVQKQVAILEEKVENLQQEVEANRVSKTCREDHTKQLQQDFTEQLTGLEKKLSESTRLVSQLQEEVKVMNTDTIAVRSELSMVTKAKNHLEDELSQVKKREEALILKLTDKELIISDLQETLLKKGEESALMAGKLVAFKNQLIDMQREAWEYNMTKKTKFKSIPATLKIRRDGENSFHLQLIDVSSERVYNILELQEVALLQNKSDHFVLNFSVKKDHREIYQTLEAEKIVTKLREYMRMALDGAPESVRATHKRRHGETYYNLASFLGL